MKLEASNIEYIVIHSSHTRNPRPKDGVKKLNLVHRMRGAFSWDLGAPTCYHHFVIRTDGTVEEGRSLDTPGNHTYGFNERSIGVCYMGGATRDGQPADTRTEAQRKSLKELTEKLKQMFPGAVVVTHKQLAPRGAAGCPGFDIEDL